MKIAYIPMSAKPFHKGHYKLITKACNECDIVNLYIGLKSRDTVTGEKMIKVWNILLQTILPQKVNLNFGGSPIKKIWNELANNVNNNNKFYIYGGKSEITNIINLESLTKYAPNILKNQLIIQTVDRSETDNISGTKMRAWLDASDHINFYNGLPNELTDKEKCQIWNILNN